MANFNIDYLVVAGGGAGGRDGGRGGGGGAGGLLTSVGQTPLTFTTGTQYTLTVGQGGLGNASFINNGDDSELNGADITLITATGGGRGGGGPNTGGQNRSGSNGGSGGGAIAYYSGGNPGAGNTPATTPSQGNNGGDALTTGQYGAGGGGGAGAAGSNGSGNNGGTGGIGVTNSITAASGTGPYYAGGGAGGGTGGNVAGGLGGGGSFVNSVQQSGTNGLGGGGAGGGQANSSSGGSGVIILRYATSDVASYTTTGITPTEDTTTISGQTILSFTTVGTGTITFTAPAVPIISFDGTKVTTPVTGFDKISVTQGLKLPSGTNTNQPTGVQGVQGMIRNDTDETTGSSASAIEHHNGTNWQYFAATESPDVVVDPIDPTGNGGIWAYYPLTTNSNDSSGNGRNATNNGVSFSADGGRFTGGNSISPPSGFINFGYTQTCWVKDLSTLNGHRIFSFNGHLGGYYGFTTSDFYYYSSSSYGFVSNQRSGTGTYYYTSDAINNFTSGYNLVVAQFVSGQLVKFSLNGQTLQTGTVSITSGNPGGPFQTVREIGRTFSNGSYSNVEDSYFRNYRLYDRTLTDAEIMTIYNYGSV